MPTAAAPPQLPNLRKPMNKLAAIIATAVAFALMAASCVDRGSFSDFHTLPDSGWAYGDTVAFTVSRADSVAPAAVKVAVRNNNDFPYSNLWLEVSCRNATGATVSRDTVNLRLADPYGRWTGKGFGASYQTEATVRPRAVIENGSRITVRHVMRADTVAGIEQLGITLSPL